MNAEPVRRLIEAAVMPNGAPAPLRPLDFVAWQGRDIPLRRWLVDDWIPMCHVSALYGDGGTGKSLLAQQLMTAAATGKPWIGRGVTACKALGVFCEDDEEELLRRQDAINRTLGVDFGDLERMIAFSRVGEDNTLMTFDRDGRGELTPLWHQVRAEALDFGAQLLVIDTAADTFGGDELKRAQVRRFIAGCLGRLAREIDGAVLLCAHPSVAGMQTGSGGGGSTAWSNSVRSRLYLTRPKDDGEGLDARVLTRMKANYASVGDEIRLRWQLGVFRVEDAAAGGLVAAIDSRNRNREADEAFLACLDAVSRQGRDVSASRNATNFACKLFTGMPQARGQSSRTLASAMERLFADGKIRVEDVKRPNRHSGRVIRRMSL